jgi:hypothetical protein
MSDEDLINVSRYFAKILCCQVADCGSPIPIRLSKYVIGVFEYVLLNNCFNFYIKKISNINKKENENFANNGGLVLYLNEKTNKITVIHSSLIFNHVQYIFNFRFNKEEINDINNNYNYNDFINKNLKLKDSHITERELLIIGLIDKNKQK